MQTSSLWSSSAPADLSLPSSDLHIWNCNIDINKAQAEQVYSILSVDEKERAQRFKFDEHRLKFIAARSTLRKILSNYLNTDPASLIFTENEYGKPRLNNKNCNIFFNISHTHNIALYAISHVENIGIDIEYVDRKIDFDGISTRFFSDKESLHIQSLPASQKATAFYKIWTAKEAFIKAIGQGLSFPLKKFEISLDDNTVKLESIYGDSTKAEAWNVWKYDVPKEYESCIAIQANTKPKLKSWLIEFIN